MSAIKDLPVLLTGHRLSVVELPCPKTKDDGTRGGQPRRRDAVRGGAVHEAAARSRGNGRRRARRCG